MAIGSGSTQSTSSSSYRSSSSSSTSSSSRPSSSYLKPTDFPPTAKTCPSCLGGGCKKCDYKGVVLDY